MEYFECNYCGKIEEESNWIIEKEIKICKYCHQSDSDIWPSIEIRKLFEMVRNYDVESHEYGIIASVFTSAAFELLLERVLFLMMIEDSLYEDVDFLIDLLLDSYQGRSRRLQLFNSLGYGTFKDHLEELKYKDFQNHWDAISEIRNKCVHGDIEKGKHLKPSLVITSINEALEVFSKLSNQYISFTLRYKAIEEETMNIETEKEKLAKWKRQVLGNADPTDIMA